MKKNNFDQWKDHYSDILCPYYENFAIMFEKEKMEVPTFMDFLFHCYINTKSYYDNNKKLIIAPIY